MMRYALALLVFAACGSHETTPAGAVGHTYDVRSDLPPDIAKKAPPDERATPHDQTFDVHGAQVKLTWRTFDDGPNKYIVSYGWSVVMAASSITFEPIGQLNPMNIGSTDAVVEQEIVRLRWHDNSSASTRGGDSSFEIDAAGHAKAN